jgi:hypothetical protein
VVIYDPRAGEIRGHKQLHRFVSQNQSWLAEHHARIETVASTVVGRRAVVELLAHLPGDGRELAWPVAVVAESPDDRSVVFRTYCSQWPVDGRRHLRPAVLKPGLARPGGTADRGPRLRRRRSTCRAPLRRTSPGAMPTGPGDAP